MKSSTTSSAFVPVLSARCHQPGERTNVLNHMRVSYSSKLPFGSSRSLEVRLRYEHAALYLSRKLTCVISDACSII